MPAAAGAGDVVGLTQREGEQEARAGRGRLELDGPFVRLHDPTAERQAEAASLRLRRVQRLEHAMPILRRNAGTIVAHAQARPPVGGGLGFHPDVAAPAQRLRGVGQQVDQDLPDLVRVDVGGQVRRNRRHRG